MGVTNKVSDSFARYYLDTVSIHGCLRFTEANDDTEHSTDEPVHISLRMMKVEDDVASNS